MKTHKGRGILIDKTKISDNKLIIRVLCQDSRIRSGVFYKQRKSLTPLTLLGQYEIIWTTSPASDLVKWGELTQTNFRHSLSGDQYDQYFLIAEICSIILKSIDSDESLYPFLVGQLDYFSRDFNAEFHLTFLACLIIHFGYEPDLTNTGIYYDFREAKCTDQAPPHADYCERKVIYSLFNFTNTKSNHLLYSGSSERYVVLQLLIRILEVQSGIRLVLNSIDVLRDIRK